MKTIYKKGIGVVLAAAMVTTGGMTAFASEATKDGSGAAGQILRFRLTGRPKDMIIRSIQIHVCHGKVWKQWKADHV